MKKSAPYLRSRKLAKGGNAFYFIIPSHVFMDGMPFAQSTPLGANENRAIQKAWELYNKLTEFKQAGFSGNPKSAKSIWYEYQQHKKWIQLADSTRNDYEAAYRAIQKVKNGNSDLSDISLDLFSRDSAENLFESLKSGGIGARTSEKIMALLRLLFNFGKTRLNIFDCQNPFENLDIEKIKPKQQTIPNNVLLEIISKARAMNETGIALGLDLNYYIIQRPADMIRLHKDHICFSADDSTHYFDITQNKTKARVKLPIPDHLLNEILAKDGFIITDKNGKQYTRDGFQRKVKIISESLGHKGIWTQKIRGSGITQYVESGVPSNAIISLSGHTSEHLINTTYMERTVGVSKFALTKRKNAENND